jgi:ABC-2 type transport system ATP-binding protein
MRQRLGLAQAMLSSPELLILDEPTNGLDPAGIREMRDLLRRMPAEHGVTVFLSSHLLSEVEQVASHIGILSRGRVLFQGTQAELHKACTGRLRIRCEREHEAAAMLCRCGWAAAANCGGIIVENANGDAARINATLVNGGFGVAHLAYERASLEDLFMQVTEAA